MPAGNSPNDGACRRHKWRNAFLEQLAQTSNVAASARKAKIDVSAVYRLRREDAAFADAWREALCEGYDNLEMDLLCRLREGELEGGKTKERAKRKYDNAVGFRLLTAHRVTVGQERARRDDMSEEAVLASINAKIDLMREREKAVGKLVSETGVHHVKGDDAA